MIRPLAMAPLCAIVALLGACNVHKSDVTKLCDAERLSGTTLKATRSQLFTWMERNVASSEAVILVRELEAKDAHGIASELHDEARKTGVAPCTFADQAELQAKDEDFHADVINLCAGSAPKPDGSIARLEILLVDDAERMRVMSDWTQTNAKSADTAAIVAKLAAAPANQRGAVLRAESAKVGVTSCLMASTLETPPPAPVPVDLHQVNPSFLVSKVDCPPKNQMLIAQAMVARDVAAAINACYATALGSTPKLAGHVAVKLQIDATGHVASAVPDVSPVKGEGAPLKGPLVPCISTAMLATTLSGPLPEGGKKGAKAEVTLELTPSLSGPGYTAAIDPAWLVKASPKHK
jgi:hypothetical protein